MKRIFSAFAALLVVAAVAVTAFAASGIHFKLTADKATAKPGDTILCSVQIDSGSPCTQFGLKFDYDTDVFAVNTGKCTATGALLTDFGEERGFAVLYESATVPAGTVGTFELKVKDTAVAGTYEIGFRPAAKNGAMDVASQINTLSITVSDEHVYGSWEKVDDKTHQRKCTDCGEVQQAEHSWGLSTVTRAPDCENTGAQTAQCGACSAKKTESINAIGHSYDPIWQFNSENHWQICLRCGDKTATGTHTMQDDTCGLCGFGGDAAAEHTHTFSQGWAFDSEKHWHICSCGVKQDETVHSWDEAGSCTVCGAVSTQADQQDNQTSQPADDRDTSAEVGEFPWGAVFVILIVLLSAGGVFVYVLFRKNHK